MTEKKKNNEKRSGKAQRAYLVPRVVIALVLKLNFKTASLGLEDDAKLRPARWT
jgi:hypothetical protein